MTSFEQGSVPQDSFLKDTLGFVPTHHIVVFEPGPVVSTADLSITIVPPEPSEEYPVYTETIRQFADKAHADEVLSDISADVAEEIQFPEWIRDSPTSREKLDAYLDRKDAVEGNPRDKLLQAAQELVKVRREHPVTILAPAPEVQLINADSGEQTAVRLDFAELVVEHPELLEETRTASQTQVGHEGGERKVWFRLHKLLTTRAQEIGVNPEDSLAYSGAYELTAGSMLYHAAAGTNHPLTSHWWQLQDGQQASGDHFEMGDPALRLAYTQTTMRESVQELRRIHEVTRGNQHTLPIEFRRAPNFEQSFLDLKARVELFSRRLAMINCGTNIAFGSISPLPAGQRYEDRSPDEDFGFTDLGVDGSIQIALKQAAHALGV
jgi:hypothetical protein